MPGDAVRFLYDGEPVSFESVSPDDHILGIMRRQGRFYETDVLEALRQRIRARGHATTAVDVGAFIGTHSVYLAKFCGLRTLAYEANPESFRTLNVNLRANQLVDSVTAVNIALGGSIGHAIIQVGPSSNRGTTRINRAISDVAEGIAVSTLDQEISERKTSTIDVIKIDVEGAELEVLRGARDTIARHHPLLCIEVHSFGNLLRTLVKLRGHAYVIIDCLGFSPTYIFESMNVSGFRRVLVNLTWLARALAPKQFRHRLAAMGRSMLAATA